MFWLCGRKTEEKKEVSFLAFCSDYEDENVSRWQGNVKSKKTGLLRFFSSFFTIVMVQGSTTNKTIRERSSVV